MRKFISFAILAMILLISCTENATDSSLQPVIETILISGALNTNFQSSQSILNKQVMQDSQNLYFSILGTSDKNHFWQHASFKFDIKIDSSQNLRSGYIFEIAEQSADNKITYQSHWNESTFTDLVFEIDGGEIRVDSIDNENLTGRFKLWAHQSSGRRMTHGQVEDLVLSNQGEINVSGIFSVINK